MILWREWAVPTSGTLTNAIELEQVSLVGPPGTVLVTGASGFVGRSLVTEIGSTGLTVRATSRDPSRIAGSVPANNIEWIPLRSSSDDSEFVKALLGVNTVVHLAARVHVMNETQKQAIVEHRLANSDYTRRLARWAADAGVRRFVFVSTVKVLGEQSQGQALTNSSEPCPVDPYGVSKYEAEQALAEICHASDMDAVILRPVLVVGKGGRGKYPPSA